MSDPLPTPIPLPDELRERARAIVDDVEWQMDNFLPAKGETSWQCQRRRLIEAIAEALSTLTATKPSGHVEPDVVERVARAMMDHRGIAEADRTDGMVAVFRRDARAAIAALSPAQADAEVERVRSALREIERLRLATSEGSLRERADRMWEIATATLTASKPTDAPQTRMTEEWCLKMAALEEGHTVSAGLYPGWSLDAAAATAERAKIVAWLRAEECRYDAIENTVYPRGFGRAADRIERGDHLAALSTQVQTVGGE